jgi:hypothetical protein
MKDATDFEWPTADDIAGLGCSLESMELSSIEWAQPSGLGCFQFVFKNGFRSPFFGYKDSSI